MAVVVLEQGGGGGGSIVNEIFFVSHNICTLLCVVYLINYFH